MLWPGLERSLLNLMPSNRGGHVRSDDVFQIVWARGVIDNAGYLKVGVS